jgi:type IV secretory pathway VirJ component
MGRVALFEPRDGHEGFVYLFSDARGWNRSLDGVARGLAKQGVAVVGVDLPHYLEGLVATKEDECHYTVAELEEWSHRLQRELGF